MYYSGLDVVVSGYIPERDKWIPMDLNNIQFGYDNPRSPIYGYNHHIMKTKMQGTALVHGSFDVNLSRPDAIKSGVAERYSSSGIYFDVDIKSHRTVNGVKKAVTFKEAFHEARQSVGPGKTFRFNNKTYSTSTSEETKGLSNASWGQYRTGNKLNLKIDFINTTTNNTTEPYLPSDAEIAQNPDLLEYLPAGSIKTLLIHDVQITNRSQSIRPTPENILETYQFIARNITAR